MRVSSAVRQCLEQEGRTNVLATSDRTGKVNVAMFGSYRLMDDSSVIVMLSDNRTMANLRENPHAACLVMLHGTGGMATEGCRLYMKVRSKAKRGQKSGNPSGSGSGTRPTCSGTSCGSTSWRRGPSSTWARESRPGPERRKTRGGSPWRRKPDTLRRGPAIPGRAP